MTALTLALLALALAHLAPAALMHAPRLRITPRAAVTLWQAVALAAVLAAIGAALAAPEEGLRALRGSNLAHDAWLLAATAIAAVLAGLIVVRLLWTTVRLGIGLRRRRQRQRDLLNLLAIASPSDARLHVLSGAVPLAYCVPGRPARVVVTDAVVSLLRGDEVSAVVEHERAHLRARHDLVLEAFTALHASFPRISRSRVALDEVSLLLEMLADDAAARRTEPGSLVSALTALEPTTSGDQVTLRRDRLLALQAEGAATNAAGPSGHRLASAAIYTCAVAILAIPTLTIVTPWLQTATAALGW